MEFVSEPFNIARQKAFTSLYNTLDKLYGRKDITEKDFKSKWQKNLEKETNVLADGWYNPPPNGMAVLFGDRVSFDTLRDNKNWASEKTINWKEELIYVYCSPIDKKSGIIGDMSLTLYFGENIEIKKHIKNCYKAVQEVFCKLDKVQNSQELFVFSEKIFEKYQLKNCIISYKNLSSLCFMSFMQIKKYLISTLQRFRLLSHKQDLFKSNLNLTSSKKTRADIKIHKRNLYK